MKKKVIFNGGSNLNSILVVPIFFCFSYFLLSLLFDDTPLNISISIFLMIIVTLLLNKKIFYSINIQEEIGITLNYPLSLFSKNEKIISLLDINKIIFFEYKYRTPSHCKVLTNHENLRFDCSENEAEKLYSFFKELDIVFEFENDKEIKYRNGEIFKKKKYD